MVTNAACGPHWVASRAYICGIMAPPAIPMIRMADPIFVNFPSPSMARGKIAGHIRAFANPRRAIKKMET